MSVPLVSIAMTWVKLFTITVGVERMAVRPELFSPVHITGTADIIEANDPLENPDDVHRLIPIFIVIGNTAR